MKKFLVSLVMLVVTTLGAHAQFEKDVWYVNASLTGLDLSHSKYEGTNFGFTLGGGSYAINGIPSGIEGLNPVELIQSMVHTAMEKGGKVKEEVQSNLALTLAKAAAIVPGQVLTNEEMNGLVDGLFAVATPNYTPDGKTVLSVLQEDELEKLFK